jgi:hypothetical protein
VSGGLTTRALPPVEWPRLTGTEAETIWPTLDPEKAQILVVERAGEIVGCQVLVMVLHAECLWVHPDHRGRTAVPRRLWAAVQAEARAVGARGLITGANDDRVRGLLAHVGAAKIPVEQYVIPIAPHRSLTAEDRQDRRIGAQFHRALESQLTADNHPDDDAHDIAVGHALRLGIVEGRADEAVEGYNAWARTAGYVPIQRHARRDDGAWVLDIQTAVIAVHNNFQVTVLEERGALCHS